jgi:kynurenine formamidase
MGDQFEDLAERVRNWGRWGAADQRGTINHITPEALKRGAAAVTQGKLFSLGLNFDRNGPQTNERRFNPQLYVTELHRPIDPDRPSACYTDDVISMPLQAATQWDALGHVHYDGELYNGCKACDVLTPAGTRHGGVEHLAQPGIMSRGVLLDIARLNGVDRLPLDHAVTVDELNAACARQGIDPAPGDIVLVRTGHITRFTRDRDRPAFHGPQPGVASPVAEWLHDRSVAAICADNPAVEQVPLGGWPDMPLPFHMLAIRDMGMPLGEMFDLEALAQDCAADGRYEFLLSAPPLAVTGAVGSPVNPLALK